MTQKCEMPQKLEKLLNRFDDRAKVWGWASDELNDPTKSWHERRYKKARRALIKELERLCSHLPDDTEP